jgi:regulator of ribosome biosynthesis
MVFDEDKDKYMPRFGYNKANDETGNWAVPHKEGDDLTVDPWTKMEEEKKERIGKNKKQQLNNIKSNLKENQVKDRVPGAIDLAAAAETLAGPTGRKAGTALKEKKHVDKALELAQKSTASMGRFDKFKKGETAPKMQAAPRNPEVEVSVQAERKQSLKVLDRIMGDSGNHVDVDDTAARVVHKEAMQEGISKGDKKGLGKRRYAGADGIAASYVMDTGKVTGSRKSSAKAQKKAGDFGGKHGQGKGKKGSSKKDFAAKSKK